MFPAPTQSGISIESFRAAVGIGAGFCFVVSWGTFFGETVDLDGKAIIVLFSEKF